jgi:hypothetical protein
MFRVNTTLLRDARHMSDLQCAAAWLAKATNAKRYCSAWRRAAGLYWSMFSSALAKRCNSTFPESLTVAKSSRLPRNVGAAAA